MNPQPSNDRVFGRV